MTAPYVEWRRAPRRREEEEGLSVLRDLSQGGGLAQAPFGVPHPFNHRADEARQALSNMEVHEARAPADSDHGEAKGLHT